MEKKWQIRSGVIETPTLMSVTEIKAKQEKIYLRGNLSKNAVVMKTAKIPKWLYAFRGTCQVFSGFEEAFYALQQDRIPAVSAIVIKTSQKKDAAFYKEEFCRAFSYSSRKEDSFLLLPDETSAEGVEAFCFYMEDAKPEDLFYHILSGDVLDYQIPVGNFSLDLPGQGIQARIEGRGQDEYVYEDPYPDIRIVSERYTRIFLIKGSEHSLMVDCGFGRGDLKKLQQEYSAGNWSTALTHGHKDHAAGCIQFDHVYGNRKNLDHAAISYQGTLSELKDGMLFDLGNHRIRVIEVSGHSARDMCFYVEPEGILICGDSITPGPSYTMAEGGAIERWILFLKKLIFKNLPIKKIYSSHREGILEPGEIIKMYEGLLDLKQGRMKAYGASVYGFGNSLWQIKDKYSYFTDI